MKIDLQPEYIATHAAFLTRFDPTAPGGTCWEQPWGPLWLAYNPHAVVTTTTKGQQLQPACLYVEYEAGANALIIPTGGKCLGCRGGIDAKALTGAFGTDTPLEPMPPKAPTFWASSKIVAGVVEITEDLPAWQDLGGSRTSIGFFVNQIAKGYLQAQGDYKATGGGVRLRMVKGRDDAPALISDDIVLGATAGWEPFELKTDVARIDAGSQMYRLQACLDGATSAHARWAEMSLLETQ